MYALVMSTSMSDWTAFPSHHIIVVSQDILGLAHCMQMSAVFFCQDVSVQHTIPGVIIRTGNVNSKVSWMDGIST